MNPVAFKLYRKSDIVAAAIIFGFLAILLVVLSLLGDRLPIGQIKVSGQTITRDHPDFAEHLAKAQMGGWIAGGICALASGLLFRYSLRVADT